MKKPKFKGIVGDYGEIKASAASEKQRSPASSNDNDCTKRVK